MTFFSSFDTNSGRFSKFDARKDILFQIKVFRSKNKETAQARYFIKITARLHLN